MQARARQRLHLPAELLSERAEAVHLAHLPGSVSSPRQEKSEPGGV